MKTKAASWTLSINNKQRAICRCKAVQSEILGFSDYILARPLKLTNGTLSHRINDSNEFYYKCIARSRSVGVTNVKYSSGGKHLPDYFVVIHDRHKL